MKVISGGQTGVDQAALRAAKALGIETGGWAPRGWLTEDGPAPWLADYGLEEMRVVDYPARTRANIGSAGATLLLVCGIVGYGSRGTQLALTELRGQLKPHCVQDLCRGPDAGAVAGWLTGLGVRVLNVAGNRESGSPGVGSRAEAFLLEVFRLAREGGWR